MTKHASPNFEIFYEIAEGSRLVVVQEDGRVDCAASITNPDNDVLVWLAIARWHHHRVSGENERVAFGTFIVNKDDDVFYMSKEHQLMSETYVGVKTNEKVKKSVLNLTREFIDGLYGNE